MPNVILDWDQSRKRGIIVSDFLDNIRRYFSVPNPNRQILLRKGLSFVSKRLYAITETGRFEIGLYTQIKEHLEKSKVKFDVITTDLLQQQLNVGFVEPFGHELASLNLKLRDYQEDGVRLGIWKGRGVYVIGTAGGKTLLMACLIQSIRTLVKKQFTTLVILPDQLVEQTYEDVLEYGISPGDISQWGGIHKFRKHPIIIAGYSTLHAKLGDHKYKESEADKIKIWKKQRKEYLKQLEAVNLVLIDECHHLRKGNKLNNILELFETPHRFGFTGTLPENQIDQWNIIGKIGNIIQDISAAELRRKQVVVPAFSQIIKITYKDPPELSIDISEPTRGYNQECDYIYHNEYRNKVILTLSKNLDNNVLIMVDRIEHGETLEATLRQNIPNKEVYFVRGSVEMEDRENIRKLMEKRSNVICVAMSKIFSTGINIHNLHYIIFAQSGKAKITLIQSIGRGLRLHPDKDQLVIFDIADNLHYGKVHLEVRKAHYKREQIKYEVKNVFES